MPAHFPHASHRPDCGGPRRGPRAAAAAAHPPPHPGGARPRACPSRTSLVKKRRTASEPYARTSGPGSSTLPSDLPIFRPSLVCARAGRGVGARRAAQRDAARGVGPAWQRPRGRGMAERWQGHTPPDAVMLTF